MQSSWILRSTNKKRAVTRLRDRVEESGQALVELALTVPLLLLLLLGAAELAGVAYAAIEVSNAASAGVQYGAQNTITASDTTGIARAASNDAANLTTLTTNSSFSCICSNGSGSTCLTTDCSTSNIEEILTVNTQSAFNPLINIPGLPTQFTLRGHAVQKVLQ
jgi:Flp pilus assembly protein TadG